MRIGVIHNSLMQAGGAERVCLKTIEGLQERGHEVLLGSVEPTDWDTLERVTGYHTRPNFEVSLASLSGTPLSMYMGLGTPLLLRMMKCSCSTVVQTSEAIFPIGDVLYMHDLPASLHRKGRPREGSRILRSFYSRPYASLYKALISRAPDGSIIANSSFTSDAIRASLGRNSRVVYPPVDTELLSMVRDRTKSRSVLSCGRYSEEKNYEFVIRVAQTTPGVTFSIVGTVFGASSRAYYEKMRAQVEERGLRNVNLVRNAPFRKAIEYFGSSMVLLNTMVNEPFGISVVEGMAAGAVPVVHRSGGPWYDTLGAKEGLFGFSYKDVDTAARAILKVMANPATANEIAEKNFKRIGQFSDLTFKKRFSQIIETTARKGGARR